jgi:DNA-binding winged helix-turn-helix (wHTH) protein
VDVILELRLTGFERRLVKELSIAVCEKGLETRIQNLTKRVGESVAKRILGRDQNISLSAANRGEDPMGDLWDEVKRRPHEALDEVLKKGYFGLLPELLPLKRGKRILYLDLEPDSLTVFDKGGVEHYPQSISKSLKLVLLELNKGSRTKEELIESVWKYEYHPVRHDSLIYSAIAKLRKVLGKRSHWIEASEIGYQWRTDVEVKTAAPIARREREIEVTEFQEGMEINLRQQQILKYLTKNVSIDVATCLDLFDTSEITSSRDLSELYKRKMIHRIGKGRATRYIALTDSPPVNEI